MFRSLRSALLSFAIGCVALPVVSVAQAGMEPAAAGVDGARGREGRRPGDLVSRLIEHRNDLALSDDQVWRLEQLQTSYEAQNRPLFEQLARAREDFRKEAGPRRTDVRSMAPEERRKVREERAKLYKEYMARHPELTPMVDQVKTNRKAHREQVMSVLTPDQQQKLKDRMEKRKADRRERGGHPGPGSLRVD